MNIFIGIIMNIFTKTLIELTVAGFDTKSCNVFTVSISLKNFTTISRQLRNSTFVDFRDLVL